jgi:hypothetical protein
MVLWPAVLMAQLGEVHLGALASYGTSGSHQAGAGLIGGVSAGRFIYVGARWQYFGGSSKEQSDSTGTYDVSTQAQIFAADVGLQYPAGKVELVMGVTIGATRYGQESKAVGTRSANSSTARVATEFLVAPNFSVQFRALDLLFIPEVTYAFGGSPDLHWPAEHKGLVFGVRIVVPIEVYRIRW